MTLKCRNKTRSIIIYEMIKSLEMFLVDLIKILPTYELVEKQVRRHFRSLYSALLQEHSSISLIRIISESKKKH